MHGEQARGGGASSTSRRPAGDAAVTREALPLLGSPAKVLSPVHPEVAASFLSRLTFSWMGALLRQGASAPLQLHDLWAVRQHDEATTVASTLRDALRSQSPGNEMDTGVVWRAIREAFGFNMYLAGFLKLLGDCLGFVGPICINELIKYVEDPSSAWFYPRYYGYILGLAQFAAAILQTTLIQQHHLLMIRTAVRVRTALTMAVYEKALALSSQTKSSIGSGHILNLATNDPNRVLDMFTYVHYTWAAPLQLILGMVLLVRFLGLAAFTGIAVMVVLIPLSALFSSLAARISKKLASCTDARLQFLNEVLRHIRIIKFYAWEVEMLDQVEQIRHKELGFLKRMVVWNTLSQVALQAGPILVSLGSFAVYARIESKPLSADAAFTAITLFNIFRLPLMMLPRVFWMILQARVSMGRLAAFLALKEYRHQDSGPGPATNQSPPPPPPAARDQSDQSAYEIRNASFAWSQAPSHSSVLKRHDSVVKHGATPTLTDVSISIPKGKLTLIVGAVGSGKSTLLAALLHELQPIDGQVCMPHDRVSFAAQSPYLVNASIEENIVFGGHRDLQRLRRVVACCEMQADLDMLPHGLQTELGENGGNLSGGQRHRVSIARAAYPLNQRVYLFDDALSALDAKVAANIFQKCFSDAPTSLLAGHTRVLASHSLQFASQAHQIIVMDKMRVVQMGTFDQLTQQQPDGAFATMFETFSGAQTQMDRVMDDSRSGDDGDGNAEDATVLSPTSYTTSSEMLPDFDDDDDDDDGVNEQASARQPTKRLMRDESRAVGGLPSSVYVSYVKSCGVLAWIGALVVLITTQLSQVATDLWLTAWTSAPATSSAEQLTFYVAVYAYLSLSTITLGFIGDLTSRLAGVRASRVIHHRLLRHIMKGSMRFFDTTPIGRVLNRFSSDVNTIDQQLNVSVVAFTTMVLSLVSMLVVQSAHVPLLLVILVPVVALYYAVQLHYRKSCRELQRLDSITKSPVYAHFTATLNGLVTIRAFQRVAKTTRDQAYRVNQNTKAKLAQVLINRWLGLRLESLGAMVTLGVACFVSREHVGLQSAMAGLLLSYAQHIGVLLNWIVRHNIDVENALNSIERTDAYGRVEVEDLDLKESPFRDHATAKSSLLRDRPHWPEHGKIVFTDVQAKYDPSSELVLRGVSFCIQGGQRVGICGRTGAGKSSLLLILFRLVGLHSGRMEIDGVDISQLRLADLRSRMAIIPQEPVLFAASIRFNLDPTGTFDDATLWQAIKKSHLHGLISRLPRQLDEQVVESGENLSLGERQLLCLARAILRNSKILCLDEATASMDHTTDTLIQSSIREEFASATVLTIAHRVQTILDYDKIMVLKRGRVAEFGSPTELLAMPNGELASMVAAH